MRAALRANEGGQPYRLSYAKLGSSGPSFGIFQADTHADPKALATLGKILAVAKFDAASQARILHLLGQACPKGSPLDAADRTAVDAALNSPAGRALVDAKDDETFARIGHKVDAATLAARGRGMAINGDAQIAIALWSNMTGGTAATHLHHWLRGVAVYGVPPPRANPVTLDDVYVYLARTPFFTAHPRNLVHFRPSVEAGARLAPKPAPIVMALP
jgi:hypothetical protein